MTYIVAPNFSIAPPPPLTDPDAFTSKPRLQLGDILTDPFGPRPLACNRNARVALCASLLEAIDHKGAFTTTRKTLLEGRFGLAAALLAALGLGAMVNLELFSQRNSTDEIRVTDLETHEMRVTDNYVKEVLVSKPVDEYLQRFPKAQLYMVSGLKIARGASMNSEVGKEAGVNVGAGDGTGVIDMNLVKLLWQRSRGLSFETSSDFVLAFQLTHIKYKGDELDVGVNLKQVTLADGSKVPKRVVVNYEGVDAELGDAPRDKELQVLDLDRKDEKVKDRVLEAFKIPEIEDD